MIVVRRAIQEDKPAIFKFIEVAYKDRWQYKIPERWQWEYVDNPFLEGSDLPVWIAVDEGGNVVGQTCALVEPLKLGDKICKVGWSVDTFLLPEYRGQGIGYQLQKANDDSNEVFMSLNMSRANRRIKAGLGSTPIDSVTQYTRLVRYDPESMIAALLNRLKVNGGLLESILVKTLHLSFIDRAASRLLNSTLSLKDRKMLAIKENSLDIHQLDRFGEEANCLWEKISGNFYAAIKRDALYLNWKYCHQPFMNYALFVARRNDEPVGILILRTGKPPERNVGVLADLFVAPEDKQSVRELVRFAVNYFKRVGVKDIVAATTIQAYQQALEEFGFRKVREDFPMFHCKDGGDECERAVEPGSWLLGKADHDWDQYPLAR